MSDRIYVQIPAYRDRELVPTVRDLFERARDPERLRVAIAWQYGDDELALEPELRAFSGVELIKTPAAESQGCNWARSELQSRWAGERYTLFLDSHHRFVDGWDERTVQLYEQLRGEGHAKPIVTAYLPHYEPRRDPAGRSPHPFRIRAFERSAGLIFRLAGHAIPEAERAASVEAAHFVSLHFLFADGSFNREIPFDPQVYFFADEVAIALRAFTHGFELFHPLEILGWHLYDRATRRTHWEDHGSWDQRNAASLERLRSLYSGGLRDRFGIGTQRRVSDYEELIGQQLIETWRAPSSDLGRRAMHWQEQRATPEAR